MKKTLLFFLVSISGFTQNKITAKKFNSRIDIFINNNLFTSYHFKSDEKYPYFFPVNGISNASVTSMRNANYPHHSSLFFGCDKVSGGNYWQEGLEEGQIVSIREDIIQVSDDKIVIENECIWKRPNAISPIKDIRKITISAPSKELYQIDFDVTMEMLIDVTIQKTNHSLFSGRLDPDITPVNGGTMINAEGKKGEKETFGQKSAWIDCHGKRGDKIEGIVIMQHPSSKWYPSPWFTRDYGFFSPTHLNWIESSLQIPKGEKISQRYRVYVHAGDTQTAKIAELFERYKSE